MHFLVQIYIFALGCKLIQEFKGIKPLNRKHVRKVLTVSGKVWLTIRKKYGFKKGVISETSLFIK